MTTIAWDGHTLAAESLITEGSMRVGYMNKIIRLNNGGYVAGAGLTHVSQMVADWMNGKREAPSEKELKDSIIFYIDSMGKAWIYDQTVSAAMPAQKKDACGSGSAFARVALEMGATAEEAVKIAMKFDTFSGGKINKVVIEKVKLPKKQKKAAVEEAQKVEA